MKKQILVECGAVWFEFTKSRTGQIDFAGKVEGGVKPEELSGFQELAGSAYFSPSFYAYICGALNFTPTLWIAPDVDVSDAETLSYLVHVGALLAAVEAKDSLLAGELYLRRSDIFDKFVQVTQFIISELCVEILFSLCYGRMQNVEPEDVPLIFDCAQEKLEYDPSRESLEQAFMRWFKKGGRLVTLPLVGTQFYNWNAEPKLLNKLCDNLGAENLLERAQKIRSTKSELYASLKVFAQAEPYNPYDENSILVCVEGIESKISGNPGLEKAGHIRALAAKIIRLSNKKKLSYKAELARIGGGQVVVRMEA